MEIVRLAIFVFALVVAPFALYAQVDSLVRNSFFHEILNDNSLRNTDFGVDEPGNEEENYIISQIWIQTGLRYEIAEDLYFDPHLVFELSADWGSEEWNDVYWNNSSYYGGGGRLSYELVFDENVDQPLTITDLNIELFSNLMFSSS